MSAVLPLSAATTEAERLKIALPLSAQQLTILHWASEGKSNLEIAALMNVTTHVVQHNIAHAMDALGTPSRTAAVARALRLGVIK